MKSPTTTVKAGLLVTSAVIMGSTLQSQPLPLHAVLNICLAVSRVHNIYMGPYKYY